MRNTLIKLFSLIFISFAFAQTLSIQGVMRDNTGASVADASHSMEFKLYTSATGGTAAWSETQAIDVVNGVYSVALGASNSLIGLDYSVSYWLGVSVDGAEELSPRTKLTLSPYAVMAGVSGTTNVFPQSGNVGIGTITPTHKLDVRGAMRIDEDQSGYDVWIQGGSATSGEARNLALLGNNTTDQLWVNYGGEYANGTIIGGNVGIGESSPGARLEIGGFATSAAEDAIRIGIDGEQWGSIAFFDDDDIINQSYRLSFSAANEDLKFHSDDADNVLYLDRLGNIGLGTNGPTHKLDVRGAMRIDYSSAYDVWIQGGSSGTNGTARNLALIGFKSTDKLYLNYMGEYTNGTIIGGFVGLGGTNTYTTVAPSRALHVYTPNVPYDANAYGIRIQLPGDDAGWDWWDIGIDNDPGDEDLIFHFQGGAEAWINPSDGAYGHTSDRTLKKNIEPIGSVLSKVMELKPSRYHMKTQEDSEEKSLGFIAQDVQEIFPNMGIVVTSKEHLGLYYEDFGVLAIAAIQEQQQLIKDQQRTIDELLDRVNQLENQTNK